MGVATRGQKRKIPRSGESDRRELPTARAPERPPGDGQLAPAFIEPMKALLVSTLPKGSSWLYEVKFDGFRALALKDGDTVSLLSRHAKSLTDRYPAIAQAVRRLPVRRVLLDGEIVAVDPEGRSSFQLLQSYLAPGTNKPPLLYYAFDLLNLDGASLLNRPLASRKELLGQLLNSSTEPLRYSAGMPADSPRLLSEMKTRGLEGVVAKLASSVYEPGRRSGAWVKCKWSQEQEFVIGGYTAPKGNRGYFGALLVGFYEADQLLFASKVGSGFDTRTLASLYGQFQRIRQTGCPFANLPEAAPGGLSAREMRVCTWAKPELVCQVRFTEWTRDHHLRHPLFLGLRDDKRPEEVVREQAAAVRSKKR
jgi:bifunctional non-homologous end joining protein LigD